MGRVIITERDTKLVVQLSKYRFLTTSDIEKLAIYPSYAVTSNRIRKLRSAGYIDTFYTDRLSEGIHQLTKQGRELSMDEFGVEPQCTRVASYSSHFAGITSILMRLDELGLLQSFTREFTPGTKDHKFQSDAHVKLNNTDFLIEYDSGLSSIQFFKPKIKAWEDFCLTEAFKEYFTEFPYIIILADRKDQIKKTLIENCKIQLPYLLVTLEDFYNDTSGSILEYPTGRRVKFSEIKKSEPVINSTPSVVTNLRYRT